MGAELVPQIGDEVRFDYDSMPPEAWTEQERVEGNHSGRVVSADVLRDHFTIVRLEGPLAGDRWYSSARPLIVTKRADGAAGRRTGRPS